MVVGQIFLSRVLTFSHSAFTLQRFQLLLARELVHVFQVATKVATLSECLQASRTLEWPLSCVLPKMVTEIARLFEHTGTASISALEEKLHTLRVRVLNSQSLMPLLRNAFECLTVHFFHMNK